MKRLTSFRWKKLRVIVVPAIVFTFAVGWLAIDGLRARNKQLRKYAVPSDHSASAMLDFMRTMHGSAHTSNSYFESSNLESTCKAILEAYSLLLLDRESLTPAEKREADAYYIFSLGASMLHGASVEGVSDLENYLKASNVFICSAEKFSSREQQIVTTAMYVLESLGKQEELREFAEQINRQVEQRPELSSDATKTTVQNLNRVLDRLRLLGKRFELKSRTIDDRPFDLESLRGKVVLIEFWGTHCQPCIADFPALKRIHAEHRERGFEIVGVCLHAAPARIQNFANEHRLPWLQLCDDKSASNECNQALSDRFGVQAVPTTLLLDTEGKVVAMGVRPLAHDAEQDLEIWIDKLFNSQPK